MHPRRAACCVFFADISDSTELYETLGDEIGRRLVLECFDSITDVVDRCGGTLIDRIGDEILCTFPDTVAAGLASCDAHRVVEATNPERPVGMAIRIGFHFGHILLDGNHIFGDTIHVARRIASLAKSQQTLTTGESIEHIPPSAQLVTRFVDRTVLKGKTEQFEIFEIVWDEGAATANARPDDQAVGIAVPTDVLDLEWKEGFFTLDAMRSVVTIGRDPRADLVFDHDKVSRLHARIEQRKQGFVYVDQSTNGSRLIDAEGHPRFLRRDERVLGYNGTIVLGPGTPEAGYPSISFQRRGAKHS